MSIIFRLNEVVGSTTGIDIEFVELIGTPGASLDGLSLIVVESDSGTGEGTIERRLDFGAGDVIGDNGFFLIGNSRVQAQYGVTPDKIIADNWIENSSYTIALVETATISSTTVTGAETVIDGFFFDDGLDGGFGSTGGDTPQLPGVIEFEPFQFGGVEAGAYRTAPLEADATRADYGIADFFLTDNTPTAAEYDNGGGATSVRIHAVQGSGDSTPLIGQSVQVEGVVTRVFLGTDEIQGFFLQEEDADVDADTTTSEGIFVYAPGLAPGDVAEGQIVSVTGTAGEFGGQTQITLDSHTIVDAGDNSALVTATYLFNVAADDREALEGMMVSMPEVTVTETFYLTRDNQYVVAEGGKLAQYSQLVDPGMANAADYEEFARVNANRSVYIDDGSDRFDEQNPAVIEVIDGNDGMLDASDTFTSGDTLFGVTGVLSVDFNSYNAGGLVVRGAEGGYEDTDVAQDVPPEVDGDLKVGSLNVQNFFTSIDDGEMTDTGDFPRGADSDSEYQRQLDKLVTQITTLDMDILGIQEIENTEDDRAVMALVEALNDALGADVYAYVPTGLTGPDGDFPDPTDHQPITNAIIYKSDVVAQVGDTAILDSAAFLDPNGTGEVRNRPAVTASFEVLSGDAAGQIVTVSSNHLKSKGSSGLSAGDATNPDSDQGDGQGFWNDTRAEAAAALAAWLDGDPTGVMASNTLIVGDLNSYAGEDPIKALMDAGYLNSVAAQHGADTYDYVFGGEWGTLDYVMGKGSAFDGVEETGSYDAAVWNANSPFPTVYDYDQDFEPDPSGAQDLFDASSPFRASDHDPIIVGLDLEALPQDDMVVIGKGGYQKIDVLANDPEGYRIVAVNGMEFGDTSRAIVIHGEERGAIAVVRVDKDGTLLVNADPKLTDLSLDVTVEGPDGQTYVTDLDIAVSDYTLELLHVADQEAGANSVFDAPNLSAVMNALEAQDVGEDATLRLSSGDAFIPGLFYSASGPLFGAAGIADIQIQNELGFEAIALGNHEFDNGTAVLAGLIDGSAGDGFGAVLGDEDFFKGTDLYRKDFGGAEFAYLSANLDASTDANLAHLVEEGGQKIKKVSGAITTSTVIQEKGEKIGVVGATTPTLASISSPGDVSILTDWAGTIPTEAELDALAADIQAEVDALLASEPKMNKVILLAHMQQIDIEFALAERLSDVDIIVAGGSNTRLMDDTDRLRDGDSRQGDYPTFIENADGGMTAVVNTDGSYKYVGRLVIDFDENGEIIAQSYDEEISGAYATDDAGVAALGAEDMVDPEVQRIADAIQQQILETEGNVLGVSDVFLNGNRSGVDTAEDTDGVRTQETNLGNLSADANLWYINEYFDGAGTVFDGVDFLVSIKNGGGIRASIGETYVPAGGSEPIRTVNQAILDETGAVVKPEGGISENDIATTLAFNNGLAIGLMSGDELLEAIEHGIDALPGVAGQFIQTSGLKFSFESFDDGGVTDYRVVDAAVVDGAGDIVQVLADDGVANAAAATQEFGVVTLNFLAGGGDGYDFPDWFAFEDLSDQAVETFVNGDATFAQDFTEQDAFAEYLLEFHAPDAGTPYAEADTGRVGDERIQNLDYLDQGLADDFAQQVDDFLFNVV